MITYENTLSQETVDEAIKEYNSNGCMDDWGSVILADEEKGIELNLAFDSGIWQTAFYPTYNVGDYWETDYSSFVEVDIDWEKPNWKNELQDQAYKAFEKLHPVT